MKDHICLSRTFIKIIGGFFIIIFTHTNAICARNDTAIVLFINSYHPGYFWSDEITRGIIDEIRPHVNDLHIEYLDTKRDRDSTHYQNFVDVLSLKNAKYNYDLIITSDNNAFEFAKKYRMQIFGNIPLVFCGVNFVQPDDLIGITNVTGVSEMVHILKNITLIKGIHPDCKEVVIVTDNTATGKRLQEEVHRINTRKSFDNLKIRLLYDISHEELKDSLKNLDEFTIVLHTLFFRDKNNVFFEYDQATKLVCENTTRPVYAVWNFSIGHGIVGGYVTSGYDQGVAAAQKALQILNGTPADEIPVMFQATTRLKFDARKLAEHNISEKTLPVKKEVFFNEPIITKKYGKSLQTFIIIISLLLVIILLLSFFLLKAIKKKKFQNKK